MSDNEIISSLYIESGASRPNYTLTVDEGASVLIEPWKIVWEAWLRERPAVTTSRPEDFLTAKPPTQGAQLKRDPAEYKHYNLSLIDTLHGIHCGCFVPGTSVHVDRFER